MNSDTAFIIDVIQERLAVLQHISRIVDGLRLNEQVIKCVVYGNTANSSEYAYWIHMIAGCLKRIEHIRPVFRLDKENYLDFVFGEFGNEMCDAELKLLDFQSSPSTQYDAFEITDKLVITLFNTYRKLIDSALPLYLSADVHDANTWLAVVQSIFQSEQEVNIT